MSNKQFLAIIVLLGAVCVLSIWALEAQSRNAHITKTYTTEGKLP